MPDDPILPKLKPGFFDLDLGKSGTLHQLYRPPTLMRTTEWGLLTFASLLAAFAFPPYFITILVISFFNAGGLLWVTHLSEKGRLRLIQFEAEFRRGYELEQKGRKKQAIRFYQSLIPRFQEHPSIAEIARRRADYLAKTRAAAPKPGRHARPGGR